MRKIKQPTLANKRGSQALFALVCFQHGYENTPTIGRQTLAAGIFCFGSLILNKQQTLAEKLWSRTLCFGLLTSGILNKITTSGKQTLVVGAFCFGLLPAGVLNTQQLQLVGRGYPLAVFGLVHFPHVYDK